MSKRMTKLIGMLLSAAMILSSIGVIAFADESDTTSTDAQATVAPIATEDPDATPEPTDAAIDEADVEAEDSLGVTPEPEITPEPTAAPSKYETDSYYGRAVTLVTALGIFEGYEDGSLQPESHVTRAEMATIVLRMLNSISETTYANAFNDVTSSHWASGNIQNAAQMGIINGFEDGSFRPDGDVTYEQVVKMIVCALGYEPQALLSGGYPNGYLAEATSLSLTDGATGSISVAADRGLVIKMVYNALLTKINEQDGVDSNGYAKYSATRTLASARFNVIDANGTLNATSSRSLDQSSTVVPDGMVIIDGVMYETDVTGIDSLVGTQVTYYYRDVTSTINPVVVAITTAKNSRTDRVVINLDDVSELRGFGTGNGIIDMYRGSDYRCPDAVINYNGVVITETDYNRALATDTYGKFNKREYDGTDTGVAKTFDEFLLPDVGTIEITDVDGDGKYDYIFIESYETMLVTSVSTKTLTGDIYGESRSINVDETRNADLELTVIRGGSEVRARNLNTDDVASIMQSLDENVLKVIVTGESVSGTVDSVSRESDGYYAVIDNKEYAVDANAISYVQSGAEGTFYLDAFGRIGYGVSSGGGKLSGNEKYGWLMASYVDNDGKTYKVKLFTQDGKAETYELASNVSYWGPNDTEASTLSGSDRSKIADLISDKLFIVTDSTKYEIRLCKYRVNSSGLVNTLYVATDADVVDDDRALVVDRTDLRGVASVGTTVDSHTISDGIVGFMVPQTPEDMNSDSEFSTFSVSSSTYISNQGGVERNFILGEFTDGKRSNVLIEFTTSSTSVADAGNYSNTADNPVIVVTGVNAGINADRETIYVITGKRSGGDVSYRTTQNTVLVKSTTDGFISGSGSTASYNTKELWNAVDNTDSIANYLHVGDVVGIQSDSRGASIMIKFVDVRELAADVVNGTPGENQYIGYNSPSETRDGYGFGAVAGISNSGDTYFNLNKGTSSVKSWYLASSATVDLIDVTTDENGFVKAEVSDDVYEPSEIMNFNTKTLIGDYMFFRNQRYNAQREAFVFRFNDN